MDHVDYQDENFRFKKQKDANIIDLNWKEFVDNVKNVKFYQKKKLEEKEKAVMERERENLGDWEEKERIFHLSQAYQKVYVRVRESRARNLHLLALVTLRIPLLIGK